MKAKFVPFCLLLLLSCIDDFEIRLPGEEPKLTIDAVISSEIGQSEIIIGWTAPVGYQCYDNMGYPVRCESASQVPPYKITGTIKLSEKNTPNAFDTTFNMTDKHGVVKIIPNFHGVPGNQYSLDVTINYEGKSQFFHAETSMLETPPIENISYEIRKGDIGKNDNFVPLISFKEPPGKNYYLFQLCQVSRGNSSTYCGNSRVWSYSLISDTFLPQYVDRLSIDDGASIAKYAEFYPMPFPDTGVKVKMYSVNDTTYFFYKALIDQFNNDGGAYAPTPATPKGNISGGALGLFRALDSSSSIVYY